MQYILQKFAIWLFRKSFDLQKIPKSKRKITYEKVNKK